MFCYIIKDKLNTTLLCLLYIQKQTVAFNSLLFMLFYLSYFSCYNIVAKFLFRIIAIMPMFKSTLIPAAMLYIYLIKIVLAQCHIKNYCFVITYLLEDEHELSLGMFIRLKRIYNFLCSMLVLYQMAHVFIIFLYYFGIFYWTNLLTQ